MNHHIKWKHFINELMKEWNREVHIREHAERIHRAPSIVEKRPRMMEKAMWLTEERE